MAQYTCPKCRMAYPHPKHNKPDILTVLGHLKTCNPDGYMQYWEAAELEKRLQKQTLAAKQNAQAIYKQVSGVDRLF